MLTEESAELLAGQLRHDKVVQCAGIRLVLLSQACYQCWVEQQAVCARQASGCRRGEGAELEGILDGHRQTQCRSRCTRGNVGRHVPKRLLKVAGVVLGAWMDGTCVCVCMCVCVSLYVHVRAFMSPMCVKVYNTTRMSACISVCMCM